MLNKLNLHDKQKKCPNLDHVKKVDYSERICPGLFMKSIFFDKTVMSLIFYTLGFLKFTY